MNIKILREFYKDFVDELLKNCCFCDFSADRSVELWDIFLDTNEEFINNFRKKEKIYFSKGSTKAVIIDEERGYVIKIPFSNLNEDYCAAEYKNYLSARDCGVESRFAECDYLFTINGCPYYIMEFVKCDEKNFCSFSLDKYYDEAIEYSLDLMSASEDGVLAILELEWGDEFEEFIDFCEDNDIQDLHGANIGKNKEGKWVIIDYSGFRG